MILHDDDSSDETLDPDLLLEFRKSREMRELRLNFREFEDHSPKWKAVLQEITYHGDSLEVLEVQGSRLTSLPSNLSIPHLRELNLSTNNIASLGDYLPTLRHLKRALLSDNKIASVPGLLRHLTALEELDLSSNAISFIHPEALTPLTNLTSLNLSSNQLEYLPSSIGSLASLETFSAAHNHLTALPSSLSALTSLRLLSLHHNCLTALPPTLGALTRLHELEMHSNDLHILPKELSSLVSLRSLTTGCNDRLAFPPLDVCRKGTHAILTYLQSSDLPLPPGPGDASLPGRPYSPSSATSTHLHPTHPSSGSASLPQPPPSASTATVPSLPDLSPLEAALADVLPSWSCRSCTIERERGDALKLQLDRAEAEAGDLRREVDRLREGLLGRERRVAELESRIEGLEADKRSLEAGLHRVNESSAAKLDRQATLLRTREVEFLRSLQESQTALQSLKDDLENREKICAALRSRNDLLTQQLGNEMRASTGLRLELRAVQGELEQRRREAQGLRAEVDRLSDSIHS